MASVSAGHIILTPTQPVGSERPQRNRTRVLLSRSRALYRRATAPPVWGKEKIQLQYRQSGEGWCSGEQRSYSYTTDSQEKCGVLGNREDTVTPPTVRRRVVFWGTETIQIQPRQLGEGWCSGEQRRYSYTTDSQKGGVLGNREGTVTPPTVRRSVVFWGTEQIHLHHRQSGEGWCFGE